MSLHKLLKEIDAKLYPDIANAGSLSNAISKNLVNIGSNLTVEQLPVDDLMPYTYVEDASHSSQVYIADEKRLFLFDFWFEGVLLGNASSDNVVDVVRAIQTWIVEKPSIEKMSGTFSFFEPTDGGRIYEKGASIFVEHQWQNLLAYWKHEKHPFGTPDRNPAQLIETAMKRPILRQLYPYTSLVSLCFSRTTGYPFTHDCPRIEPQGNGKYLVYAPDTFDILGEGLVEEVLNILIVHLPPNCGPAVNGTADDCVPQQK